MTMPFGNMMKLSLSTPPTLSISPTVRLHTPAREIIFQLLATQKRPYPSTLSLSRLTPGLGTATLRLPFPLLIISSEHNSHAQYSIGDFAASAAAFEKGLALEPSNANLKSGLDNARARLAAETASASTPSTRSPATSSPRGGAAGGMPNMADLLGSLGGVGGGGGGGGGGMADLLSSLGGGAGGGGMPDLGSLLNNPQLMQMASQLAANGGLERLMQDPTIAQMVCVSRSWVD